MLRISGLKEPYIGMPRSKPSFSPSVRHSDKMSFNAVTPLTKDTSSIATADAGKKRLFMKVAIACRKRLEPNGPS